MFEKCLENVVFSPSGNATDNILRSFSNQITPMANLRHPSFFDVHVLDLSTIHILEKGKIGGSWRGSTLLQSPIATGPSEPIVTWHLLCSYPTEICATHNQSITLGMLWFRKLDLAIWMLQTTTEGLAGKPSHGLCSSVCYVFPVAAKAIGSPTSPDRAYSEDLFIWLLLLILLE